MKYNSISNWQYLVFLKTKSDSHPLFLKVCNDFNEIQTTVAEVIEEINFPEGFENHKKQRLAFSEIKKRVKKILKEKAYLNKIYSSSFYPVNFVTSKHSNATEDVCFEIEELGTVYISEITVTFRAL